jgi:hypothetical protein
MEILKLKSSLRSNMHKKSRVLVLYNSWFLYSGTLADYIDSFARYSRHDVLCADVAILGENVDLAQFDAIILHYSLVVGAGFPDLGPGRREKIINADAQKFLIVQDEMRWVNMVTDAIAELGISVLFSVQSKAVTDVIYKTHPHWNVPILPNLRIERVLTGFVDENLLSLEVPQYEHRKLDVVYRARMLPYWIGRAGMEKGLIAERFLKSVKGQKLKLDISTNESDRIYADAWFKFMASSKATLGAEGSASLTDYDNTLFAAVDAYCKEHPEATFDEVEAAVFPGLDSKVVYQAISPRCFEAAALRTLMIQYEGEYSGVLEAHKHYVVLERDHSNIKNVLKILRDPIEAGRYIDAAYDDVAASGKYTSRAFLQHVDRVVDEEIELHGPDLQRAWDRFPYRGFWSDLTARNAAGQPTSQAATPLNAAPELAQSIQGLTAAISALRGDLSNNSGQVLSTSVMAAPEEYRAETLTGDMASTSVILAFPVTESYATGSDSAAQEAAATQSDVTSAQPQLTIIAPVPPPETVDASAQLMAGQNDMTLLNSEPTQAQLNKIQQKEAKAARNRRIRRSFALYFLPKSKWDWMPK